MPLDIAIIGAGISGLAAAIALSRDGHTVNVYERRPNPQQLSGSGLQIQPSAIKILRRWGLLDGFAKVAHESGSVKMRRYQDGNLIAAQMRKGSRGCVWSIEVFAIGTDSNTVNGIVCATR